MASGDSAPQMIWSKLECSGYVPEARKGHTAVAVPTPDGRCPVFVFGGVVGGARVNTTALFRKGDVTREGLRAAGHHPVC